MSRVCEPLNPTEAHVLQPWVAHEICVLDTGSTDRTVEILRSLGAKVTVKKYDKWKSLEELDALNAAYKAKTLFPKSRMAQITVNEILAVMSNPKNKPRPIQPRHRIELSGDY